MNDLHSPSHGEVSNGYNTPTSQPNEHDAELFGLAWFELRYLVQYTVKGKVVQTATPCVWCIQNRKERFPTEDNCDYGFLNQIGA